MLVDINLMPQKEKRRSFQLLGILMLFFIVAAVAIYSWFAYDQQVEKEVRLQQQLASLEKLEDIQQEKQLQSADESSTSELETAISWAENYPVSTFLLLRHLASLLPERGFLLNFSYQDSGDAQLTIQFDSSRESAFYLKRLEESTLIKEATLLSIVTETVGQEESQPILKNDVLPRYITQYTLKIDLEALKLAEREGEVKP
jgi:type IV pilus assembly protein PilN